MCVFEGSWESYLYAALLCDTGISPTTNPIVVYLKLKGLRVGTLYLSSCSHVDSRPEVYSS